MFLLRCLTVDLPTRTYKMFRFLMNVFLFLSFLVYDNILHLLFIVPVFVATASKRNLILQFLLMSSSFFIKWCVFRHSLHHIIKTGTHTHPTSQHCAIAISFTTMLLTLTFVRWAILVVIGRTVFSNY